MHMFKYVYKLSKQEYEKTYNKYLLGLFFIIKNTRVNLINFLIHCALRYILYSTFYRDVSL